jgi:hypothetical protein
MIPGMAAGLAAKAGGQIIGGLTGIAGGIIGGGKRRREQREAQIEFDRNKARYENLDTSNLATGLENAYEDLTVNTQAADFAAQQQQQALANTMGSMQGAAGGSGIAALAQAMAGQQSQNLQQAGASIAQQESANQMKAAQGDMTVQSMELQGAQQSRAAELDKTETLLGMSQQRLGAANEARQKATDSLVGGIGSLAGGVGTAAAAGKMQGGEGFSGIMQGLGLGGS